MRNLGPAEAFLSSRGVSFPVRNAKCEIPTWTPHLCADACRVCSVSPPGDCHAPQMASQETRVTRPRHLPRQRGPAWCLL